MKLQEITDLLPFLVKLDATEKRGIATIGTEREALDSTFSAEMSAHPELIPSYVNQEELASDRELRADLQEILQRTREVCEALEDTAHITGSDVLLAYLAFYANVKQAADRAVPAPTHLQTTWPASSQTSQAPHPAHAGFLNRRFPRNTLEM